MLPKLKLPQTCILARMNTEPCLQQNISAFKCQRVMLKEDVAEGIFLFTFYLKRQERLQIPSNQWPKSAKVYHFF